MEMVIIADVSMLVPSDYALRCRGRVTLDSSLLVLRDPACTMIVLGSPVKTQQANLRPHFYLSHLFGFVSVPASSFLPFPCGARKLGFCFGFTMDTYFVVSRLLTCNRLLYASCLTHCICCRSVASLKFVLDICSRQNIIRSRFDMKTTCFCMDPLPKSKFCLKNRRREIPMSIPSSRTLHCAHVSANIISFRPLKSEK